jgi:hypothetical protein
MRTTRNGIRTDGRELLLFHLRIRPDQPSALLLVAGEAFDRNTTEPRAMGTTINTRAAK